MLHLQDIHTYYGQSHILFGVNLQVQQGQIVTLMGRNGMGKTTTIRSIMGLTPITDGTIRFNNQQIGHKLPHEIAHLGLGLVPEGRQIFPTLTVEENLLVCATPPRHNTKTIWDLHTIYHVFPQLQQRRNQIASTLSGGEQQLMVIARALATNPSLLILDEATEGLSPLVRQEIWHCITHLKQMQQSILIVDKNLDNLIHIANYHYVLEKGQIAWHGTSAEITDQQAFAEKYLGV